MNLQQRIASSFGLTIVILLIAVSPQVASAQSSFPTCVLASYQWSFNSQNQSPCEVAAQLLGVCTGGSYTLPSLPMENHYLGPTIDTRNPCQCSTVAYSMVSACAACQNSTITAWSEWTTNCATVSLDVFPEPIPQGTFVPGWAFLDVKASDGFDPIPAKDHANATESTALPMPSSTARATRSLTSSIAGPSSGSTPTEAAGSSAFDEARSNAIGGGVVGGLAGVTTIFVLVLYLHLRRRRKSKVTSTEAPPIAQDEEKQVPELVIRPPSASFYQTPVPLSPADSSDATVSPSASDRSLVTVPEASEA